MTSNQFFTRRIHPERGLAYLDGDEHRHLARSARTRVGDRVWLFDDSGVRYLARVEKIGAETTELRILEAARGEARGVRIVLGQAVLPPRTMDLIIRQATELGVSALAPVVTTRSLKAPAETQERRLERWGRIAREAAKQSKSGFVPAIEAPLGLRDFAGARTEEVKILLSENGGPLLRDLLLSGPGMERPASSGVVVLVGPEGGWTEAEEELLASDGFRPYSLGRLILRTETAALAGLAMISHFWTLGDVSTGTEGR